MRYENLSRKCLETCPLQHLEPARHGCCLTPHLHVDLGASFCPEYWVLPHAPGPSSGGTFSQEAFLKTLCLIPQPLSQEPAQTFPAVTVSHLRSVPPSAEPHPPRSSHSEPPVPLAPGLTPFFQEAPSQLQAEKNKVLPFSSLPTVAQLCAHGSTKTPLNKVPATAVCLNARGLSQFHPLLVLPCLVVPRTQPPLFFPFSSLHPYTRVLSKASNAPSHPLFKRYSLLPVPCHPQSPRQIPSLS